MAAVMGIVACNLRLYPYAISAQGLWRLSSTITYSNAAGLLFAMVLLIATSPLFVTIWTRLAVAVCASGLIATQSRSAVLAVVICFLVFARRELILYVWALIVGTVSGLITVAASSGVGSRPVALALSLLVIGALPLAGALTRSARAERRARQRRPGSALFAVLAALVLLCLLVLARSEVVKRIDYGSDVGRVREWGAALSQFRSSPWTGSGPDMLLPLHGNGGVTYFAHNEYLQVLAGGGVVGGALLIAAVIAIVHHLRHPSAGRQGSLYAALAAFAIAGFFDFTWHVPSVAILAGATLGFATLQRLPSVSERGLKESPAS
jgi:O-antigen ligase